MNYLSESCFNSHTLPPWSSPLLSPILFEMGLRPFLGDRARIDGVQFSRI